MTENCRYDITGFHEETGLDMDDVIGLYGVYLEEIKSEGEEIINKLNKKDFESLRRTIHNVKGISANYKVTDVYKLAKEIDLKLKEKSYDNIDKMVHELILLINESDAEIRNYFETLGITL